MTVKHNLTRELALLGLLALFWGASYPLIKIAVTEVPPLTLIASRVAGAALLLLIVMALRKENLPRDAHTWRMLLLQAILNSIGAWTILAWGQQFVDAGLASVLNSTSPIFVFLFTLFIQQEPLSRERFCGALIGMFGVVLIVGFDARRGVGKDVAGQIACLISAALYAGAAIHGKRFGHISPVASAAGTMIWAALVLVLAAILIERPWTLSPSVRAMAAIIILSVVSTAIALLIYFRLVRTIGSMGVASQAYLRAAVGLVLGQTLLGESFRLLTGLGLLAAIIGVALINWPIRNAA